MMSTAVVVIDRPARYGKQLASHLGHRSTVVETVDGWELSNANGTAMILPNESWLELRVEAESSEALARLCDVLERHLRKFAAKEGELIVDWS